MTYPHEQLLIVSIKMFPRRIIIENAAELFSKHKNQLSTPVKINIQFELHILVIHRFVYLKSIWMMMRGTVYYIQFNRSILNISNFMICTCRYNNTISILQNISVFIIYSNFCNTLFHSYKLIIIRMYFSFNIIRNTHECKLLMIISENICYLW